MSTYRRMNLSSEETPNHENVGWMEMLDRMALPIFTYSSLPVQLSKRPGVFSF